MGQKPRLGVVLDCADPERLMGFWRQALGYRVHYSEPSLAVLVARDVHASPLILQQVPEPKAGKNRMHVDIITDDVDVDVDVEVEVEVERLEALGARRVHDGVRSFGQVRWLTMADP